VVPSPSVYDGESKSCTRNIPRLFVLDPIKSIKNLVEIFAVDSKTVINNLYAKIRSGHVGLDVDASAGLGIVDGIGYQVPKDTFQRNRICHKTGNRFFGKV